MTFENLNTLHRGNGALEVGKKRVFSDLAFFFADYVNVPSAKK